MPLFKGPEANSKAFTQLAGRSFPRMANCSFDYGNTHWGLLDSNKPVEWTNAEIRDWLAKELAAAKSATWRFVAFHHPGFNSSREHFERQQMRPLAPTFEAGEVDIVFNGHIFNGHVQIDQRSLPVTFVPDRQGTQFIGGRDGKTIRGRVFNGRWTLDHAFGKAGDATPKGILELVTGDGGQHLYNPEQQDDAGSWQKFTDEFVSMTHSITVVDGKAPTVLRVSIDGNEVDTFRITKRALGRQRRPAASRAGAPRRQGGLVGRRNELGTPLLSKRCGSGTSPEVPAKAP